MRQRYGLGRKGSTIFPKTRRLIVRAGQPSLPFGWVRIFSPAASSQWLQERQAKEIQAQQEKAAIERQALAEATRIERQILAEKARKAQLSPLERSIEEVIAAVPNQAGYISLLQALKKGQWEKNEEQQAVAQVIRTQMEKEKVWKETSQAKKPEKDRDYQRTLDVLKWLR